MPTEMRPASGPRSVTYPTQEGHPQHREGASAGGSSYAAATMPTSLARRALLVVLVRRRVRFPRGAVACGGLLALLLGAAGCGSADLADEAAAKAAKEQAQEVVRCFVSGDFHAMAERTLPVVVEGLGGVDAMARRISDGTTGGPKIVKATVEEATIHRHPPAVYAVAPFTLEVEGPAKRRSYLLGVSNDGGHTWHFLDGAGLTPAKLKRVLPDFPDDLKLPRIG
jgi:hypothetical protein